MSKINFVKRIKKSEAGFTLIEIMIATTMSLVILGLLAHVFRAQQKEFGQQTGLNTLQANGRAATELVSRSVQAAGFNVKRGTRFLTASDHYLTAVYDSNNDGVIQNDEVMTYSLANPWSGTADDNHTFTAFFDVDGDGIIQATEKPDVPFQMTTSGGPPFNLYKVTPTASGTAVQRSLVARNIDNMVIKYYDRNGELLPKNTMVDDDNDDTTPDVAQPYNVLAPLTEPDNGNWSFVFPKSELNDIRKVEIEVLARSRKRSPREVTSSGNYLPGSLAALTSGSTSYSDQFMREDFSAEMAPRNLVLAPWGNIDIRTSPATVACPTTDSTVTATLLDGNGDPVGSTPMTFTSTGDTTIVVSDPNPTSNATTGEATTDITFNYATPYYTATVSASANITDVSGTNRPVFNAVPINFSFGSQGGFAEPFDGTQPEPWAALGGGTPYDIPPGQEYFATTATPGNFAGSVNGCGSWANYAVQANVLQDSSFTWANNEFVGVVFRYIDANNYYYAALVNPPGANNEYFEIGKIVGGTNTPLLASADFSGDIYTAPYTFEQDTVFTIKVQVVGDDIRAKIWKPADPTNPGADEPTTWTLGGDTTPLTISDHANGRFGVAGTSDAFQFDDIVVTNPS